MTSRFRFISTHRATFGVKRLCRVLAVSRSGFYRWTASEHARQARVAGEDALAEQIRIIHAGSGGAYGSPRVTVELHDQGVRVNRNRVERIMRQRDVVGRHLRRRKRTTIPDPAGQEWAEVMAGTLLMAKQITEQAVAAGRDALTADEVSHIRACYVGAVAYGREQNPPDREGKLSRAGRPVERFATHRDTILRFTVDLAVPFTNNQAERDLRPVKLQQKISATWRTLQGLADFATLRSYLSTAAKHGMGALDVLKQLFTTEPWLPQTATSS